MNGFVPEDAEAREDYEAAKAIVLAEPESAKPNIVVTMRGNGSLARDGYRELSIRIDARM